ncbi:MAG: hypothetical protein ACJ79P_15575, partial [Myxococcales bacterium]
MLDGAHLQFDNRSDRLVLRAVRGEAPISGAQRRNDLMLSTRVAACLAACIALCLTGASPARAAADVIDLGTLSPGQNGEALAINDKGEVVGFSASFGFRWTAETGMTALPLPAGAFFAAAEAI